jgi:moderate conductance mechanosensitive channel
MRTTWACWLRVKTFAHSIAVAILWSLIIGSSALAQTAPPASSADAKFQEFIKMLDDPDIRARLQSEAAPTKAPEPTFASQIVTLESAVRTRLTAMRNVVPKLPGEAASAVDKVKTEINNRGFATIIGLFAVLLGAGFAAERLFKRAVPPERGPSAGASANILEVVGGRLLADVTPPVVFFVASVGVFLAFDWPALLHVVILTSLVAFAAARLVIAIGRILLSPAPNSAAGRPLPMSDGEARFWYSRLVVFISYLMAGWAVVSLLPDLGFSTDSQNLISYLAGLGLLTIAIEIVWHQPGGAARRAVKNWLLTICLIVLWGLWIAGFNGVLWLGIYALLLPKTLTATGHLADSFADSGTVPAPANSIRKVVISRGARALVILLAVLWLAAVMRLHPGALAENNPTVAHLMRGLLRGIITLLVADLLWQLAKVYIDRKLELSVVDDTVSPAEAARRSRLRTLLPIFRNMLAVLVATVAVLMVLAELGVQIGPLIAGAGIFGVAIGFGSQTLVKDVISGVFYMLDDAFRIGEYIQSGSYKGTVESFSLRSVKLRHHRGPVFTVPFGDLGAVQNMSRDWVIDKFMIRVPFDTDVKKVKKILKEIGAELLADPELAPQIIETVKMKGVEQFGDFGMELSFAFMAKPGHQSVVRRRAYTMIQEAFATNGIEFAQPTVQVDHDEKQTAAAAASATARIRKQATQPAEGQTTKG